jgi:tetratricopeptide (TPR) repeat protein
VTGTICIALLMLWQGDPDQARFEQAQQLASQGRCREAIPVFRQLADAHPRIAAIPFALGQCEFENKNYLPAIDAFGRVLAIDPHLVEARSMRGAALGLSGRTAEAIEELRQASRENDSFAPSFRLLGMFEVENGQIGPEARTALKRAVALDSSDARAHYWLAQLHLLNEDFDPAVEEFSASLALQPQSPQARLGHAKALAGSGQTEAALAEFLTILQREPASAEASLGAAQCYYNLRKFPIALEAAREASQHVEEVHDRRAALWLLSRLYRVLGDPQKALENERLLGELEKRMNDDLARFRTLQEEAMRYRSAGDFAKVASTLEAALRLEQRQDSLVMLGDAYRALQRPKDAEQCYIRALAAGPEQREIAQRLEEVRAGLEKNTK